MAAAKSEGLASCGAFEWSRTGVRKMPLSAVRDLGVQWSQAGAWSRASHHGTRDGSGRQLDHAPIGAWESEMNEELKRELARLLKAQSDARERAYRNAYGRGWVSYDLGNRPPSKASRFLTR